MSCALSNGNIWFGLFSMRLRNDPWWKLHIVSDSGQEKESDLVGYISRYMCDSYFEYNVLNIL
jgi:hypothetical protein